SISPLPPPPALYPLSLHDALPILPSLTSIPCLPEPRAPSPNFALPSGVCTIPAVTVPRFALIADSSSTSMASALTAPAAILPARSEEHTSELQSRENLVCRLLLEK